MAKAVTRRHDLELGLDLFANLLAHKIAVHRRDLAVLEPFLQLPLDFLLKGGLVHHRWFERAARHQHFAAQAGLRFGRQLAGAPLHQEIDGRAGNSQQEQVQHHDAGPFSQPDFPARNRFHGHHLHLAFLDVARQRTASQPERREAQQRDDGAEGVGQQNLREPARCAVVLDDERQPNHRAQQQYRQYLHQPVTERGFQGQPGDGKEGLHQVDFKSNSFRFAEK